MPHPLFKRQMPRNENWIYDPNHAFYEFTHSNSAPYSYDEKKDINDLRIFFLGGSSMLGVGANGFEKTIPGIYKKLAESLNCSKNLFIYNDGNNGYSPKLDFIKLSTKILDPTKSANLFSKNELSVLFKPTTSIFFIVKNIHINYICC